MKICETGHQIDFILFFYLCLRIFVCIYCNLWVLLLHFFSNVLGELSMKESSKSHQSNDSKSNGMRKSEEKLKFSESNNVENMERKINNRNIKKENDNYSEDIPAPHPLYGSPTKSDDSEQGSISDLTATNGSSPVSSTNGTPSRKTSAVNFQIGTRLEAKDLGNEIW